MVYKATNKTYDFRKFKTIRVFGNEIKSNVINMNMENEEQNELLRYITKFKSSRTPNNPGSKKLKEYVLDSARALLKGIEMVFKAFESGIFLRSKESQEGEELQILTLNQILKILPVAFAPIKAGNNSEKLLNEIRQIVYSLIDQKKLLKKYTTI